VANEDQDTTAKEGMVWSDPHWPGNRLLKRPAPMRRRALLALSAPHVLAAGLLVATGGGAGASPAPVTMNGVPEQVIPAVPEVGLGSFSMPTGTTSIGSDGSSSAETASAGTSIGVSLSGSSYDTMISQSWGALAASNAQTLGVNPVAVAATCVVESGCQNISGTGSITGAFQMMNSTYTSAMAAALADHPELASSLTSGLAGQSDPATQSIAAAEYLRQAAQQLQTAGISNPTVLDVRGSYNFGPGNGVTIAQADGSALMSSVVRGLSASNLAANGITATTTVQQWRDSVSAKIGSASSQSVLLGV
jgi:hypothetical protein